MTYYVINNKKNRREAKTTDFLAAFNAARTAGRRKNEIYEVEDENGVRLYIRYLDGSERFFI